MSINDLGPHRIYQRDINEFVGVCRALAARSSLTQQDVMTLDRWLSRHRQLYDEPVLVDLVKCLREVQRANCAPEKLGELLVVIQAFVGSENPSILKPSFLHLDNPPPRLEFDGKRYCFTGTFHFGTRSECEAAVKRL